MARNKERVFPVKHVDGRELCPRCGGSGVCPGCNGKADHFPMAYGRFYCDNGKCKPCGGSGWVS